MIYTLIVIIFEFNDIYKIFRFGLFLKAFSGYVPTYRKFIIAVSFQMVNILTSSFLILDNKFCSKIISQTLGQEYKWHIYFYCTSATGPNYWMKMSTYEFSIPKILYRYHSIQICCYKLMRYIKICHNFENFCLLERWIQFNARSLIANFDDTDLDHKHPNSTIIVRKIQMKILNSC